MGSQGSQSVAYTGRMEQHAYAIEAEQEEGITVALGVAERALGLSGQKNPDVVVLRHGLLTVEDARRAAEHAAQGAFTGDQKVIIIAALRAYHEAQNALLKVFEEPAPGVHLFLVLPSLGGLLPTLRSRVQVLDVGRATSHMGTGFRGAPTMTDSGGFQVFSLGAAFGRTISKFTHERPTRSFMGESEEKEDQVAVFDESVASQHGQLAIIDEEGVTFTSHHDGSLHRFTPERSVEIQHALGADLFFAFDVCFEFDSFSRYVGMLDVRLGTDGNIFACRHRHGARYEPCDACDQGFLSSRA
ncbi:MAG: hypothetical protein B7W98_01385 [Parcubacteria group bacterium 20-58-5]|nr:MAG: hypothetical protein B7W98_01385 [Parcubacteria group bacterium 20-58-5]